MRNWSVLCPRGCQFTSPLSLPITGEAKLPVNGVGVAVVTPSGCQILPCECGLPEWQASEFVGRCCGCGKCERACCVGKVAIHKTYGGKAASFPIYACYSLTNKQKPLGGSDSAC